MEDTQYKFDTVEDRNEYEQRQYRQRRRQRRMQRKNRREYAKNIKDKYIGVGNVVKEDLNVEEGYFSGFAFVRIILCVLSAIIGAMVLNSNSEKTAEIKAALDSALNENISAEGFMQIKEKLINTIEQGNRADTNFGEIEGDYIDEMNKEDEFYKNQKN